MCCIIQTCDVYIDMLQNSHLFDTSDYPTEHPLYTLCNKKGLGKMKDETVGHPPLELVRLKPKMYSLKMKDSDKNTFKSVAKASIRR